MSGFARTNIPAGNNRIIVSLTTGCNMRYYKTADSADYVFIVGLNDSGSDLLHFYLFEDGSSIPIDTVEIQLPVGTFTGTNQFSIDFCGNTCTVYKGVSLKATYVSTLRNINDLGNVTGDITNFPGGSSVSLTTVEASQSQACLHPSASSSASSSATSSLTPIKTTLSWVSAVIVSISIVIAGAVAIALSYYFIKNGFPFIRSRKSKGSGGKPMSVEAPLF